MFAKLESGMIRKPGKTITLPDGRKMTNWTPEEIASLGFDLDDVMMASEYKKLVETPEPDPESGFYFVPSWTENDTEIVRVWTKYENEPEPVIDTSGFDKMVEILRKD